MLLQDVNINMFESNETSNCYLNILSECGFQHQINGACKISNMFTSTDKTTKVSKSYVDHIFLTNNNLLPEEKSYI